MNKVKIETTTPADHFVIEIKGSGAGERMEVTDLGFETRAMAVLELAYRNAFLEQPLLERMKGGVTSYADKTWSAGGKEGRAKKVLQYSVAAGTFVVLTTVTGPGVLVVGGVMLGALALKKGLGYGITAFGSTDVQTRLKAAGDPKAPDANSPGEVLKVMLEHGGIQAVTSHLVKHWREIRLFNPPKKPERKREEIALEYFERAPSREEAWREWDGGSPAKNYLDKAGLITNSTKHLRPEGIAERGKANAAAAGEAVLRAVAYVTKSDLNTKKPVATDRNFMRLKIKKLTYYNACLMDYCRSFMTEHARIYDSVANCWEDVTKLVRAQVYVGANHEHCPDAARGCAGGYAILQELAETMGGASLLDTLTPASFQTAPSADSGALFSAHVADRAQAVQSTSSTAKGIRLALGWAIQAKGPAGMYRKGNKKVVSHVVSSAISGAPAAAQTGDISAMLPAETPQSAVKRAAWNAAMSGQMPSVGALSAVQIADPIVPCAGAIASDITDLFFNHFGVNLDARERMTLITEGLQELDDVLEHGNNITSNMFEFLENTKSTTEREQFFLKQLPTAAKAKAFFDEELASAASKLPHYVKKADQRRAEFLAALERITTRDPAGCADCGEAYELAHLFFKMLKTTWKLEQSIMILYTFAKGIACSMKKHSRYHMPVEAAGSLAGWFEFWHHVPAPATASAAPQPLVPPAAEGETSEIDFTTTPLPEAEDATSSLWSSGALDVTPEPPPEPSSVLELRSTSWSASDSSSALSLDDED